MQRKSIQGTYTKPMLGYNKMINKTLELLDRVEKRARTIQSIIDAGEIKAHGNTSTMKETKIKFKTVYETDHVTVTPAFWECKGQRFISHTHANSKEYLICVRGRFLISIEGGQRVIGVGECVSIPKGTMHDGVSLEDNSEIVAVCIPAEEGYRSR